MVFLPRPASFNFQLERSAQKSSDEDDGPQHHHIGKGRGDGDRSDNVARHEKFEPQQDRPPQGLPVDHVGIGLPEVNEKHRAGIKSPRDNHHNASGINARPHRIHERFKRLHTSGFGCDGANVRRSRKEFCENTPQTLTSVIAFPP